MSGAVGRQVRPLVSLTRAEARRRVMYLYRAWYRQVPLIVSEYDIPKSVEQCNAKLREKFLKHKDVKDIRVIDMLVLRGQMELKETAEIWKQKHGIMDFWREDPTPQSKEFLGKFLDGH